MVSHAAPRRRRPALIAGTALLVVGVVAGALTAQVRAAGAAAEAERAAVLEAMGKHWATFGRVHEDRRAAATARARAQQAAAVGGAVQLAWSASASDAEAQIAAAASLLAETEGEVADDAVRTAVGDAVAVAADALATASDAGPDGPSAREVAAVSSATSTLRAATGALSAAHQEWLAARAAAARPAPSTGGYAGDCGGPGSYQAPRSSSGTRFYTSVPAESGDGSNGNLPRSAMTPLSWCVDSAGNEQWLRSDAAAALVRMNEAFRTAFGENIAIDLSYRSYDDQVLAKQLFGRLAATPGTSNHGWGTAFDTWEWPAYDFGSERYTWLVENGPGYGWYCPAATEPGNPEYWHYEFRG